MSTEDSTYAGLFPCPKIHDIEGKDRIGYVDIGGNLVIVRKDQFKEGDLGLFIYVDSVLPVEMVEHYQLAKLKNGRVKTMRMAGITSQGLFLPLTYDKIPKDATPKEENLAPKLDIGHWKPDVKLYKGQTPHINARNWPQWLDVMHISRLNRPDYAGAFSLKDDVVVTEKIHGMNCTFAWTRAYVDEISGKEHEEGFSVMSRKVNFKRDRPLAQMNEDVDFQTNAFYSIADRYDLENKMKKYCEENNCDLVVRGEIFGKGVQDLTYGMDGIDFRMFDVQYTKGRYEDWHVVVGMAQALDLQPVPKVYEGKYNPDLIKVLAQQGSMIDPSQIIEGVVVRTALETTIGNTGERKQLKLLNPAYLARDDSKEVAE